MAYFWFLWRSNRGFLVFAATVVALFQVLMLRVVTTFEGTPVISALLERVPPNFMKMFGEEAFSLLSADRAAAFGLSHPVVLVVLSIAAIRIPSRHIAGEAETGTLELLLSFPVRRVNLLLTLVGGGAVFLLGVVLAGLGGSLGAIALFHHLTGEVSLKMAGIAGNLWLLFVLVMAMTTVLSTFGKEGSRVVSAAAGITLVFYLLHYLSSLWETLRVTKPFNIFTYYQPTALMSGERALLPNYGVLGALILACVLVSAVRFQRRDIPG